MRTGQPGVAEGITQRNRRTAWPCHALWRNDMEEKDLLQVIEAFPKALSAENRVILMCRCRFSGSGGEIAAQTGLSGKNVSVRLARIRKQLRHDWDERAVLP